MLLKSQFLALLPYLGIKTLDWAKTKWPAPLVLLETRAVIGDANPIPRPPHYDEDCIFVHIAQEPIMKKFAEKVAEHRHLDEVGRWIQVMDYGKYGTMKLVEYVLCHL